MAGGKKQRRQPDPRERRISLIKVACAAMRMQRQDIEEERASEPRRDGPSGITQAAIGLLDAAITEFSVMAEELKQR